ncbi:uncharacterized protein LOC121420480 [Lytechinus variegatus]|uniref:uncharacterized protein LOC121420480 n=1 Tax=Lytechinus variegatus TaxID=7654 RepID=UPI001BB18702|nr:uncharacterized protein LOC121420480 [Lytechinus variegatus]
METSVLVAVSLTHLCLQVAAQFIGDIPPNGGFVSEGVQPPIDPLDPWASVGMTYPTVPGMPGFYPLPGFPMPGDPMHPANRGNPVNPPPPPPPPQAPPRNPWIPNRPGVGSQPGARVQPGGVPGVVPGTNPNTGTGNTGRAPINPFKPPVQQPPVNRPPVQQPPVQRPPVNRPPVQQPPVQRPPVQPPVQRPPQTPRPPATPRSPHVGVNRPNMPSTPGVSTPGRGQGPVVIDPIRPRVTTPRRPGTPPNRRPTMPRHPHSGPTPSRPYMTCAQNPCQNRGVCTNDPYTGFKCECRHLYLGERCEVIISPPQHINIDTVATTRASISWRVPPAIDEEISGFIVQYNKFGFDTFFYSPFIHPSVADFTLTDLEPDSQYTVCVSTILVNHTQTNAVLRDQCVEVRTRPLSLNETGLPVTMVAIILGGVVVALILVMLLALCCQRKCLQTRRAVIGAAATVRRVRQQQMCEIHGNPKTPLTPRLSGGNNSPKKEHQYSKPGPPVKERALPKIASPNNRVPPSPRTQAVIQKTVIPVQHARKPDITTAHVAKRCVHANNANSTSATDPLIIDIPPTVPEHDIAMKAIKKAARTPNDYATQQSYYARSYSISSSEYTEHSMYGARKLAGFSMTAAKTTTHPPSSVIRALPKTVSNHMMRIKNARDKDATSDFDMARTHFLQKA